MKKIYILFLSIAVTHTSYGQITLTAANNNPAMGDSFTTHSVDGSTINSGASGANVTWDYSTMVSTATATVTYVTPSALSQGSSYPLSNMASGNSSQQAFYVVGSTEYSIEGFFMANTAQDIYTDVREFYKFPITYLGSFSETFSGTSTNIQAGITYPRGGLISINADAYGTLIMPYGTINNVLRIKTTTNYADTLPGPYISAYTDVHYFWFNANTKGPILAYDSTYSSLGTTYLASYLDVANVVTGIGDNVVQNSPILAYPNPANDIINISLAKTYNNAFAKIVDLTGKVVKSKIIANGVTKANFPIADLEKGIYFIQIVNASGIVSTNKFIKQ